MADLTLQNDKKFCAVISISITIAEFDTGNLFFYSGRLTIDFLFWAGYLCDKAHVLAHTVGKCLLIYFGTAGGFIIVSILMQQLLLTFRRFKSTQLLITCCILFLKVT